MKDLTEEKKIVSTEKCVLNERSSDLNRKDGVKNVAIHA